ncbi:MAG: SDR family NAD(P)-dependent oxidoreductase [Proteobacteria bacterium]|nr:SDR family NAD(P)-dependent oxidoreductase [Pseudomonadota bacterium]
MSPPDLGLGLGERTAVVTGASRGLGAGLAREFARQGLRLGLFSRSDPALPAGDRVVAERLDVRDEAALERFVATLASRFGAIDLWVNNAGVLDPMAPLRDIEASAFREHVDINLTGVFLGTRAFVRHLHDTGRSGVLINVSSGAAAHGYEGWSAYCAGKAGVERLTECVQMEEAGHGLRAFAVAPGVIDTDMQERIRGCTPDRFPEVERFRQMKRDDVYNTPEYVARELLAIAFDPDRKTDAVAIDLRDEKG